MTRRTRRTIFYILVALFVILGTVIVLYAEGWRINFTNFHAEKVGGIYVRAYPQNAAISLNGVSIPNQSNFLSHGTLISDLYPKNYTLSLSLAGYDAWQETASVEPSLVVEMKYAVLVPQTGTSIATTSDIVNYFAINGDNVEQHMNGAITWRDMTVATGSIVSHSTDLKNMIYEDTRGNYDLYDFTTDKTINLSAILQKQRIASSTIGTIEIDPFNDTAALVTSPTRILTIDLEAETATIIATSSPNQTFATTLAASQPYLAWSAYNAKTGSSTIVIYDKFANDIANASLTLPGATQGLTWITNNTLGVLQNNGSLSLYTLSTDTNQPLASDVKAFYPTSDGTMLAALENDSVEIFDFGNNNYYRFNLPAMAAVQSLAWYKDESHLFVTYPDHVSFFDLADTSLTNVTTVSSGTIPSYDPQANSLYLLDSGNLVQFDFPN